MEKALTIRLKSPEERPRSCDKSSPISPSILLSPSVKISPDSSSLNSPLVSPPSSAFVSALQSPYISPRAHIPTENPQQSPPLSQSGSQHSDDIPSSSYTPPPENTTDFSGDLTDQKLKFSTCISDPMPPRISFSFPAVPHVSRCSLSPPPQSAKLRSCDVYVGYHGQNVNLVRFCIWLKSELELHGIACFVADRARYSDTQSLEIADRIICSATFGVVVITGSTFLNPFSVEEIRVFNQKKNLIPLLFETDIEEVANFLNQSFDEKQRLQEKEWREMVQGLLLRSHEFKLEAYDGAWRDCVARTVGILKSKLGRKSVAEKEEADTEFPYPRNRSFVGRQKELQEMELSFFGSTESDESKMGFRDGSDGTVDGFAVEESDTIRSKERSINLVETGKCKESTLDAWVEPVIELTNKGRSPQKQRQKPKKSRHGSKNFARFESAFHQYGGSGNIVCLTGNAGSGKTELALEFAYRYAQRYKLVLWVEGDARYFRQNILNLSAKLGLDVTAETHTERGRVRSFEDQEMDAFQRVRRELFRDIPYLLVVDNLETETDWWDGIDVQDLIPRSSGAIHVIITTRLSKVSSFKLLHVPPLPLADVIGLMKGKRKKDYPTAEVDILRKFYDRLGQSSFGLGVVACLLFELAMSPSSLLDAINKVPLPEAVADSSATCSPMANDNRFFENNQFLMGILSFCFTILCEFSRSRNLTARMVLAGAWLAPAPVSASILAACAKGIPENRNGFSNWKNCVKMAVCSGSNCFMVTHTQKWEAESALLIVKLGLARRCNKQPGCSIRFHDITRTFARRQGGITAGKAMVQGVRKIGKPLLNFDHLWSAAFLVLGFKSELILVHLSPMDLVLFIRRVAIPLALCSFTMFSRCNASLELLKLCTNMLEEVEKSFVSQIQDWCHGSLCWRKKNKSQHTVDEYVWQDVTLLKATLLETRAKLLLRGGRFDSGEELCRTCISIRTVMLGHHHPQTVAAQETLAKLVRFRSKV